MCEASDPGRQYVGLGGNADPRPTRRVKAGVDEEDELCGKRKR